ncbi:collectin-12-like, partial [Salvelinus namaycush]|uniref:Collectin-12-like n=1 Tax=Salvelinus namaycush TaxID=8040 RepID=A0A8U0QDE4_SALNM
VFVLVVQRVDNVTEEMQNYGGKVTAVETDLKKLDDQTGEKADNASSDISTFKSDIQMLQSQLDNVSQRASTNRAVLNQLQVTGEDMQSSQASLQSLLDSSTASLHSVNTTLASYGGIRGGLQTDSTRLQDRLQGQVREQGQTQVDISNLNRTQAQQGRLLSALQRSVEDAGQAVQRLKNNFHGLQQTARQTQADTDWLREKVQNLQVLTANNSALAQSNGEVLEDMGLQLNTLINQTKNTSFLTEGHNQSLRLLKDQQKDHKNTTSSRFDEMEARLNSHKGDINRVTGNFSFANQLLGIISSELNSLRTCAETVTHHSDLLLGLNGSVAEVRGDGLELQAQQDELTDRLDREVNSLSLFMEEMKMVDRKQSQLISNFTILQACWTRIPNVSISCVHGDTKQYPTVWDNIVTPQGNCQMMVGAVPELPVPLLVGRDCPLFAALWRHELRKKVRAGQRRERGQPIACAARMQTVDQPVSMGPELESEGVPEPDPLGESREEEPSLLDFEGPVETPPGGQLRGQFGTAQWEDPNLKATWPVVREHMEKAQRAQAQV